MVKVILGKAGSGKTKQLIDMVNTAVTEESGNVVCIENGQTLRLSIKHSVKLVDISEYGMELNYEQLYAFLCGMYCGNYDITHIFVDGLYKVTGDDDNAKAPTFLEKLESLTDKIGVKVTLTLSLAEEDACACIKKYL